MSIKDFHDLFRFIINREIGGWVSPSRIDTLSDMAQMDLFDRLSPRYMESQEVADALSPFLVSLKDYVTDGSGVLTLDADYERLLGMGVKLYKSDIKEDRTDAVDVLTPTEVSERLNSHIMPATLDNPVCTQAGRIMFKFVPAGSYRVTATFLRRPVRPKFDYTTDPNNPRVMNYNKAGSIDLEWRDPEVMKVMVRAMQMAGVNINDQMVIQYSTMKEREEV